MLWYLCNCELDKYIQIDVIILTVFVCLFQGQEKELKNLRETETNLTAKLESLQKELLSYKSKLKENSHVETSA